MPHMALRFASAAAAALVAATLAGCGQGVLDPAGPIAGQNRLILFNALAIMLAIVVPTMFATVAFAWWFRASNDKARYRPDWHYSGRLELLVWSIPTIAVIFLGGVAWVGSHDLDPRKPIASDRKPLSVEVVALDWRWLFIYPEQGVASLNRLVIPTGTPVRFRITSASVMNSFFIPQLGSQIYAMAGMATELYLQADRPGQYFGFSAHYSGAGFPSMRFETVASPQPDFDAWVARAKAEGKPLDVAEYRTLVEPTRVTEPALFKDVEPGLFHKAIMIAAPGMMVDHMAGAAAATDGNR